MQTPTGSVCKAGQEGNRLSVKPDRLQPKQCAGMQDSPSTATEATGQSRNTGYHCTRRLSSLTTRQLIALSRAGRLVNVSVK